MLFSLCSSGREHSGFQYDMVMMMEMRAILTFFLVLDVFQVYLHKSIETIREAIAQAKTNHLDSCCEHLRESSLDYQEKIFVCPKRFPSILQAFC